MPAIKVDGRIIKFKSERGHIEFETKRIDFSLLAAGKNRLVARVGESIKEIFFSEDQVASTIFQNGTTIEFQILSDRDLLLQSLSREKPNRHHHTEIKAPMPGLVVDILVKKGDRVNHGGTLVILEAMKMENEIRVPHDSEVVEVFVKAGDVIEKDQVIATLK
jgi:biotin carboxyl carrier protein